MSWLDRVLGAPAAHSPGPHCEHCGKQIPPKTVEIGDDRGTPAKYCTIQCRRRAKYERVAQRVSREIADRDRTS